MENNIPKDPVARQAIYSCDALLAGADSGDVISDTVFKNSVLKSFNDNGVVSSFDIETGGSPAFAPGYGRKLTLDAFINATTVLNGSSPTKEQLADMDGYLNYLDEQPESYDVLYDNFETRWEISPSDLADDGLFIALEEMDLDRYENIDLQQDSFRFNRLAQDKQKLNTDLGKMMTKPVLVNGKGLGYNNKDVAMNAASLTSHRVATPLITDPKALMSKTKAYERMFDGHMRTGDVDRYSDSGLLASGIVGRSRNLQAALAQHQQTGQLLDPDVVQVINGSLASYDKSGKSLGLSLGPSKPQEQLRVSDTNYANQFAAYAQIGNYDVQDESESDDGLEL